MSARKEGLIKILFDVDTGDGELPPVKIESIWAEPLNNCTARLRNVPYFACGVALGDVVEVEVDDDGAYRFLRVSEPGGNSTVHAFIFDEDARKTIIRVLAGAGCTIEIGPIQAYLAINVSSVEAAEIVRDVINRYSEEDVIEFQVSCSRHGDIIPEDV